MAIQSTALDRMFAQVTARRRGTKDPVLPHGRATAVKRHVESCRSAGPRLNRITRLAGR